MSADFSTELRREIAELEALLAKSTTYRRLNALRAALREYENVESVPDTHPTEATGSPVTRTKTVTRKPSAEREAALQFARDFLDGKTTPTPTREIFAAMEDAEIGLAGANPMNNLSAMLSNSDEFNSHGRRGWVLAKDDPLAKLAGELDVDLGLSGEGPSQDHDDNAPEAKLESSQHRETNAAPEHDDDDLI